MIPSSPIRGRAAVTPASALAVDVLVAVMEGLDVVGVERHDVSQDAREMYRARDVLAHDGRLDGVAGGPADREHPVRAHEDGARVVAGERLHDPAADLLVADQR